MKIGKKVSTILKGFSALFVLINHIDYFSLHMSQSQHIKSYLWHFSNLGMFSFLFLSGYGLYVSTREKGLKDYWDKRIKNVFIPAVLANIIGFFTYTILGYPIEDRATIWNGIFMKDFFPMYNSTLWFLHLLIVYYFLFYFIKLFSISNRIFVIMWIICGGDVYNDSGIMGAC